VCLTTIDGINRTAQVGKEKNMLELALPRLMGCDASFEEARIVVFGAGFDGTATFRPGSRFGPQAVRSEFYGLETYSPALDMDITELAICDAGDFSCLSVTCRRPWGLLAKFQTI